MQAHVYGTELLQPTPTLMLTNKKTSSFSNIIIKGLCYLVKEAMHLAR
jgi:hypothetical protein